MNRPKNDYTYNPKDNFSLWNTLTIRLHYRCSTSQTLGALRPPQSPVLYCRVRHLHTKHSIIRLNNLVSNYTWLSLRTITHIIQYHTINQLDKCHGHGYYQLLYIYIYTYIQFLSSPTSERYRLNIHIYDSCHHLSHIDTSSIYMHTIPVIIRLR